MSIFGKIRDGLKKTRDSVSSMVGDVLSSFTKIDEDFFEELEETLILCDIGVVATGKIIDALRQKVKTDKITDAADVKALLIEIIADMLHFDDTGLSFPSVVLVVGVNGVGKTTSIGKLAKHYKDSGKKVYLAAADTFRAAAVEQLSEWGQRSGVKVIKYGAGADPAAVVYDDIDSAKHNDVDLLICDTAGRLHNKKNLMDELAKSTA